MALTNENAGSDGDVFCHSFKLLKLGPLVGKRTWGGVVGISPHHTLVDGTVTTRPSFTCPSSRCSPAVFAAPRQFLPRGHGPLPGPLYPAADSFHGLPSSGVERPKHAHRRAAGLHPRPHGVSGRRLLASLTMVPFVLPSITVALGFLLMYGPTAGSINPCDRSSASRCASSTPFGRFFSPTLFTTLRSSPG